MMLAVKKAAVKIVAPAADILILRRGSQRWPRTTPPIRRHRYLRYGLDQRALLQPIEKDPPHQHHCKQSMVFSNLFKFCLVSGTMASNISPQNLG